jgi:hypothetical protein
MISYLAEWTTPGELTRCSDLIFKEASNYLPRWSRSDWNKGCAWQLLREAAMWQNRLPQRQELYLNQARALLGL